MTLPIEQIMENVLQNVVVIVTPLTMPLQNVPLDQKNMNVRTTPPIEQIMENVQHPAVVTVTPLNIPMQNVPLKNMNVPMTPRTVFPLVNVILQALDAVIVEPLLNRRECPVITKVLYVPMM
jgi:hypothetical protein